MKKIGKTRPTEAENDRRREILLDLGTAVVDALRGRRDNPHRARSSKPTAQDSATRKAKEYA